MNNIRRRVTSLHDDNRIEKILPVPIFRVLATDGNDVPNSIPINIAASEKIRILNIAISYRIRSFHTVSDPLVAYCNPNRNKSLYFPM